jgi:predicted nuclease with TOPRIM domain
MESENEISTAVLIEPESVETLNGKTSKTNGIITNDEPITFQKLEEKATKAQEAFEKEEKLRKELEGLNSKLLAEKTALLDSLSGEKGALQDFQEKSAKLTAQKNDLDNQLRVSIKCLVIAEIFKN